MPNTKAISFTRGGNMYRVNYDDAIRRFFNRRRALKASHLLGQVWVRIKYPGLIMTANHAPADGRREKGAAIDSIEDM
jgi:hypothetical protein